MTLNPKTKFLNTQKLSMFSWKSFHGFLKKTSNMANSSKYIQKTSKFSNATHREVNIIS